MRLFSLLFMFCAVLVPFAAAHAQEEGIASVVNQDAITMSDLNNRMRLIGVSSGLANTPDIRAKLARQVINSLIEEQLMIQEAKKQDIEITQPEIDQGFATLAAQNKISPEEFRKMITGSGIEISTMERQIRAQIGWQKIIQKVMRPKITVTDADIDEYIARITAQKGRAEYLLAEIYLPVDSAAQDAETRDLAQRLVNEIRAGKAPFPKIAQQFSRSPGASQGGMLGWVPEGQLAPELEEAVKALSKDGLTEPVRMTDGYHILLLRDKRALAEENIPTRDQAMSAIGVQRLDRAQRRYLMDLKSSAFIENRIQENRAQREPG
jgi:peptidyl-prolyl cis-trans isomerase SurA